MKNRILASIAAALVAATAQAVTLAPETMETRLQGVFDSTTADGVYIDLAASYGYFFYDNFQAGARVHFADNDDYTRYGAGAFAEYNFEIDSEDWLPFVEGSLGLAHMDAEGGQQETALVVELQAGMKFFLAPNVAVSGAAVLDYATEEIYQDDDTFDDTDIRLVFAIRYYY